MTRETQAMLLHSTPESPVGTLLMCSVRYNRRFPEHNDWPERELWRNRIVRGIRLELGAIAVAKPLMVTHARWPTYAERSSEEAATMLQYLARPHSIADGDNFDAITHRVAEARGARSPRYHDALAGFVVRQYLRFLAGDPNALELDDKTRLYTDQKNTLIKHDGSMFHFTFELPDTLAHVDQLIDRIHLQQKEAQ